MTNTCCVKSETRDVCKNSKQNWNTDVCVLETLQENFLLVIVLGHALVERELPRRLKSVKVIRTFEMQGL